MKKVFVLPLLIATVSVFRLVTIPVSAQQVSEAFGTGANQFTINFNVIGNPSQTADTTGYGYVPYTFNIGTYVISQNQLQAAVASGLEHVQQAGAAWSGNKPAANMSWYEAAAFANWLNTSKGYHPAYNLSWNGSSWSLSLWTATDTGYDANNAFRNSLAHFFLPTENEFYKAAYGKSDGSGYFFYSTGSDSVPTPVASGTSEDTAVYSQSLEQGPASVEESGGRSSYDTQGQGGNVFQWYEGTMGGDFDNFFGTRGSAWDLGSEYLGSSYRGFGKPMTEQSGHMEIGFRVASVPEPSTYALLLLSGAASLWALRRRKS